MGRGCIRTAQMLIVSLTIPSLRMKKLRLREVAVLSSKWQGQNANPDEPDVKLSDPGMGVSFFLRLGPV